MKNKDFIFKVDNEIFKAEHRLSNRNGEYGIFITRKMDNESIPEAGFGYVYDLEFIESGEIPSVKAEDYKQEFINNLPLYKAALDKYKKLVTFL